LCPILSDDSASSAAPTSADKHRAASLVGMPTRIGLGFPNDFAKNGAE
jgi:hypothetical protein